MLYISGMLRVALQNDYYPFGMPMPNRNIQDANAYRYAYQGQEKDPETGKEAFELRLWDSRIGRWLTTDPYGQYHSPYLGMGNNPINSIDPDGGFESKWWAKFVNLVVGGNGVGYNSKKGEYYVKTSYNIVAKNKNINYNSETNTFDMVGDGIGFKRIYENPFHFNGDAQVSVGIQLGGGFEALGVNVKAEGYIHRINLYNVGWKHNKNGFKQYHNGTLVNGETPDNDVTGFDFSTPVGGFGREWRNEDSNDLLIPGSLKKTYESIPIYGNTTLEFDKTGVENINTVRTRNWTLSAGVAVVLGIHGKLEFGYTY